MLTKAQMTNFYRLALLRVLAGLFVQAGIEPGTGSVETLPRFVRSSDFAGVESGGIRDAAADFLGNRGHENSRIRAARERERAEA